MLYANRLYYFHYPKQDDEESEVEDEVKTTTPAQLFGAEKIWEAATGLVELLVAGPLFFPTSDEVAGEGFETDGDSSDEDSRQIFQLPKNHQWQDSEDDSTGMTDAVHEPITHLQTIILTDGTFSPTDGELCLSPPIPETDELEGKSVPPPPPRKQRRRKYAKKARSSKHVKKEMISKATSHATSKPKPSKPTPMVAVMEYKTLSKYMDLHVGESYKGLGVEYKGKNEPEWITGKLMSIEGRRVRIAMDDGREISTVSCSSFMRVARPSSSPTRAQEGKEPRRGGHKQGRLERW